jgi:hypothetical protein
MAKVIYETEITASVKGSQTGGIEKAWVKVR